MSRSAYTARTRLWVLLTLLAYAGQLLGISAHASMAPVSVNEPASKEQALETKTLNQTSLQPSHCHSQPEQHSAKIATNTDVNTTPIHGSAMQSCCDDNCQMSGCHGASAAINSIDISTYSAHLTLTSRVCINTPSKPISSLYRPPNLV